jgi:hypothetical protein
MTVARPADILALGTATPVGLRSDAVAAAIRGGLHRGRMVKWRNKKSERQRMSLLADGYLPVLDPALVRLQRSDAARRMVRLATYALREACAPCTEPPPVLLALPEERRGAAGIAGPEMVRHLATQAGVKLDERGSRIYRQGGAGGLFALSDALGLLASDRYPYVLVGGVDTFFDSRRLAELDVEDRLSGSSMDGFVLAAMGIRDGYRKEPCLVWSTSDGEAAS